VLTLLPFLGFSYAGEDDFFYFNDTKEEALYHIAQEGEGDFNAPVTFHDFTEKDEFDQETASLFEADLDFPEELPWDEEMSSKEITAYVEKKARRITPDYDDVFSYDAPSHGEGKTYAPTSERVPEGSHHFFGRPRVVHSQSDPKCQNEAKKKNDKSPIKRPPIADKKPQQPKTVAKRE